MPAVVVVVLIACDYECARKLSANLFLGSQKQAFLASWYAIYIYMYIYAIYICIYICYIYNVYINNLL